jgi:hypothetical protein
MFRDAPAVGGVFRGLVAKAFTGRGKTLATFNEACHLLQHLLPSIDLSAYSLRHNYASRGFPHSQEIDRLQ